MHLPPPSPPIDTAFMFIIGGLFLAKLFQNRHPDINVNVFIAFFSFAVIIFTTLIGIVSDGHLFISVPLICGLSCYLPPQYFDRRNPVAVRITIFIFILVPLAIFFLSFYKFHRWKCSKVMCSLLESIRNEIRDYKTYFRTYPVSWFRRKTRGLLSPCFLVPSDSIVCGLRVQFGSVSFLSPVMFIKFCPWKLPG